MDSPPPVPQVMPQDKQQLQLLSLFYLVLALLSLIGLATIYVQYQIALHQLLNSPAFTRKNSPFTPDDIRTFVYYLYFVMGIMMAVGLVTNLITSFCLWRRKFRILTLILAGINCLQIPFGTVSGVFTFYVLSRPSVRRVYAEGTSFSASS